jgi:hypothetical protein
MTNEEHEELHKKFAELEATRTGELKLWNIPSLATYFVKDGWVNGVVGERALTCGFGEQQKDGWYYMLDNMDDGVGPHDTEQLAKSAAIDYVEEQAELQSNGE